MGNGGSFHFKLNKRNVSSKFAAADELWNNLICGVIGATILPASMITGVRLVDRITSSSNSNTKNQFVRLEVWFTDGEHLSPEDRAVFEPGNPGKSFYNGDYKKMVAELQSNVERCMLTRLDGRYDATGKLWDVPVTVNYHNESSKK